MESEVKIVISPPFPSPSTSAEINASLRESCAVLISIFPASPVPPLSISAKIAEKNSELPLTDILS